jgi:hypothetical protein
MANEFDKLKEALDKIKPAEFKWESDPATMNSGVATEEFTTVDLDTIAFNSVFSSAQSSPYGNITITTSPNTSGQYLYSGVTGPSWGHVGIGSSTPSIKVTGDAEFDGDVKIKGYNISKVLEDIQNRLAILVPNPEKLEHFESLKKAYDHYKTLEALCQLPEKEGPK